MSKLSKKNLNNIKHFFEEETGTSIELKDNKVAPSVIIGVLLVAFLLGGMNYLGKIHVNQAEDTEVELINYNSAQKGEEGFEVIVGQESEESTEVKLSFEDWVWPTDSDRISSFFGKRENGLESDHINIPGSVGDPIYAVYDGTVLEAGYEFQYGNYIVIKVDDNIVVKYGHLNVLCVAAGDKVCKGDTIGEMGSTGCCTGPNLSFGMYIEDEGVNPLDE